MVHVNTITSCSLINVQPSIFSSTTHPRYHFKVNDGAEITGSHIQYVDYDRAKFSTFMENDSAASEMVTGMGEMIEKMINLKGEPVGLRNKWGKDPVTSYGAHYGNADADGKYTAFAEPKSADWFIQSLCSAHLEEKHQWGEGIGLEDDIFITNEEWMHYAIGENFVGIGVHALDLENKALYAVGAFTQGMYTLKYCYISYFTILTSFDILSLNT